MSPRRSLSSSPTSSTSIHLDRSGKNLGVVRGENKMATIIPPIWHRSRFQTPRINERKKTLFCRWDVHKGFNDPRTTGGDYDYYDNDQL